MVAVFGAYLVLGVPAAVPSRADRRRAARRPQGVVELLAGAALSWKQLVTIAVPVGSYQALLVPPFLLGLVAATVGGHDRPAQPASGGRDHPARAAPARRHRARRRARRARRRDRPRLPRHRGGVARPRRDRRTGGRSRAVGRSRRRSPTHAACSGASALIAVALVGATAASVALPVPPRNVVRAELQPPFEPRAQESPLAGFRAAFDRAVAGDDDARGARAARRVRHPHRDARHLRRHRVLGRRRRRHRRIRSVHAGAVPARPDRRATARTIDLDVDVLGYSDVWVPGIGQLERIAFDGARAETSSPTDSSTTTSPAPAPCRRASQSGDGYSAASVAPLEPERLAELEPGTSVLPAAPELPAELARLLDEWAPASDERGERLEALIAGFRREGYVSHGREDERLEPFGSRARSARSSSRPSGRWSATASSTRSPRR